MEFTALTNLINKIGYEASQALIQEVVNNDSVASGKLLDALQPSIAIDLNEILLLISLPDYAIFVDEGTPPRKEGSGGFMQGIAKWISEKGLPEKSVYPIARNIWKNGVSPRPFLFKWNDTLSIYGINSSGELNEDNQFQKAIEFDIIKNLEAFIKEKFQ